MPWSELVQVGDGWALRLPAAALSHLQHSPQETHARYELLPDGWIGVATAFGSLIESVMGVAGRLNLHDPRWDEALPPRVDLKELWRA